MTRFRVSFSIIVALAVSSVGSHAADPEPPPSAECRYALRQAESDSKSESKARACRERCAPYPSVRAKCPKPARPPDGPSACQAALDQVAGAAEPTGELVQRCVDRCAREPAAAERCRQKAHDECTAASLLATRTFPDFVTLRASAATEPALAMCRLLGDTTTVAALEAFRARADACLGPASGAADEVACSVCKALVTGEVRPDCVRPETPGTPGGPLGPDVTNDGECDKAWRAATDMWLRGGYDARSNDRCIAACDPASGTGVRRLDDCAGYFDQAGHVALERLLAPNPAPWTLAPAAHAVPSAPWLDPLPSERRSLTDSGWAVQGGLGVLYRDRSIRRVIDDHIVTGDGVGGVFEARAMLRAERPSIGAEVDGGLVLALLPDSLYENTFALERGHFVLSLRGDVGKGLFSDASQLHFSGQIGGRRMADMGLDVHGTPMLWGVGLGWSDLARGGSGLRLGLSVDGADYGRFLGGSRGPVGLRLPIVATLSLAPESSFSGYLAANFAPRWLDVVGFAYPAWATLGASGCPWPEICVDFGVDLGVRGFSIETDGGFEGGPYYELPMAWIARAKASLEAHLAAGGTLRAWVTIDPITVAVPAEEEFKRPHPIDMALLLADAPLAWNGASYLDDGGYYHGDIVAGIGLDFPNLPLSADIALDFPLPAKSTGLAAGLRLPLGPVALAVGYRGTARIGGGYERDFTATLGVDFRGRFDR